jgi:hypothetical protein
MPGYHYYDLHDDVENPGARPDDQPDFSVYHTDNKSEYKDRRQTRIEDHCAVSQ